MSSNFVGPDVLGVATGCAVDHFKVHHCRGESWEPGWEVVIGLRENCGRGKMFEVRLF